MTPISALSRRADNHPRQVAFNQRQRDLDLSAARDRADRLARGLLTRGVWQGDRVALHMTNLARLDPSSLSRALITAIAP
jgi:acyl-CoA synthetase (AMP-forming)/AMP-acid ligase II